MRLAWFSPMPPVRSGIATCSAELVKALRSEYSIDVFVDEPVARVAPQTRSAHDFVWLHRQRPFDLTVYELGNSSHHDFQWPYLFRYPGLAVLHDAHLHHARAAALLRTNRAGQYREEFAANHPDADRDLAELVVHGFDSHIYYMWPMTRLVVEASRLTAVHSRPIAEALRAETPGIPIEAIRLGHGSTLDEQGVLEAREQIRSRYGIPQEAILFGVFGALTPEKRIPRILDAFAALLPYAPDAWLLLGGAPADHYDPIRDVLARGIEGRVVSTGYLEPDSALTRCIAATDVTLNLRWPTAREMSGPWLRCLAAGKPTVIIDLLQTADVPALDPRTWVSRGTSRGAPVSVAIDLLDEEHSLRLAMRRLASDKGLRASLGRAAREHWLREHSVEAMVEDYRRIIPLAAARNPSQPVLPAHLIDGGGETLEELLGALGVAAPWGRL